ncbi:MAG: hypothetical protein K0S47_1478 [Herbinix sp.]|jgi:ribosomal-protein-alanine N-acetyltransferase|nr:hypothetical protein [Herbinix sp.]
MSYDDTFIKLPVLETNRLRLRQITKQDGKDCLEYINDYQVYRYWGLYDESTDTQGTKKPDPIGDLDHHYNEVLKEYQAGRELCWMMELKDSHKVIGEFVLYDFQLRKQADIGYRINSNYWGQGYAPEAGQAIIKAAFEYMDLERLQIRCFSVNLGSIRVAEKLNFRQEGYIKKGAILNVMTDYYIFGFLKEDYLKSIIPNSYITILP